MSVIPVCDESLVRVIPALEVSDAILTSLNVPEDEHSAYSASETYADQAYVIVDHVIYQNNSAGSLSGVYPPDDPLKWTNKGATNAYAMFDSKASTLTQQAGSIEFTITAGVVMTSLALFGLTGSTVTVTVIDPVVGLVFSKEESLISSEGVTGFFSFIYREHKVKTSLVFSDLPPYRNASITVRIDAGAATASCGMVAMGRQTNIGQLQYGFSLGILDFSEVAEDDEGYLQLRKGNYVDEADIAVYLERSKFDNVKRKLTAYRATPAAYICGTSFDTMAIFGKYESFSQTVPNGDWAECTLSIRGLI